MLKVVGLPRSRTMRVIWMLEELGVPYDLVPAEPHSDAARAGNPGGKIPVLHDGGAVLTDSVAIVTYLADKHGKFSHPAGTLARARQDAMTQFCVDEIEGALWTAAKNTFVHPPERRTPAIVATCHHEFANAMQVLERHLAGRAYLAGDDFTVPDLLVGHCAGWAVTAKFPMPSGAVADYLARMRARPALARGMARADATMSERA